MVLGYLGHDSDANAAIILPSVVARIEIIYTKKERRKWMI